MKKSSLALLMCGIMGVMNITTYAVEKNEFIAQKAEYQVMIEGNELETDKPIVIINGTTYLPLTSLSEALGMKVNWNSEKGCIEIEQKNIAEEVNTMRDSNGLTVTSMYPKEGQQDAHFKWGYLTIAFNEDMKKVKDINKIYLISEDGERIGLKYAQPGITAQNNIIIAPAKELDLDTNYKLIIPKNTMQSTSDKSFEQEIVVDFKTSKNVVKGEIKSTENYFGQSIVLKNSKNSYVSSVIGKNEFVFVDIPKGTYELILEKDGKVDIQSELIIKEDMINNFIIK